MALRDPTVPQSDDEALAADLIRLLRIVGPLGRLQVADHIVPVVNMGDVVSRAIIAMQPMFRSIDRFSAGVLVTAAANTIHADTGALPEGSYDVQLYITVNNNPSVWKIEHRNAANTANVTQWNTISYANDTLSFQQTLAYEFAENERLRILNRDLMGVGEETTAFIFARRRT